jgi:hypothetical protein
LGGFELKIQYKVRVTVDLCNSIDLGTVMKFVERGKNVIPGFGTFPLL